MTSTFTFRPGFSDTVDRWIDSDRRPQGAAAERRARIVVVGGWFSLVGYTGLVTALGVGGAPGIALLEGLVSLSVTVLALCVVRWGGRIEAAAWILTINLAVTPLAQASLDLGIRDPALALTALAPLAGALTSGPRLAVVGGVVGVLGTIGLYLLHATGHAVVPYSTPDDAAAYAIVIVAAAAALSASAGAIYARHTGQQITRAEGESSRLDAALRASEQRYRSLFDHLPVGMYRTAADGRILLANPALARMVGAESVAAARGYNASDFYADPADRARFSETVIREGAVRGFETRWRRPDGQLRYVRIDAHAGLDDNGQPIFFEGSVEDITSEREARIALHRSEARFKALVQRSSDVVVVADREDRLTYVSPTVSDLLGLQPESLIGHVLTELIHAADLEDAKVFLAQAQSGKAPSQVEFRLRHADGHEVFVEGAATALYDDPAVNGLVLNLRDATNRKRAEAVLVHAKQQAEEVAAIKSTFIANMSHEIRTPLTAILGFADVLGEEVEDETQSEFVGLIARSGKRLMDTLNSVLDIARLEAEGGELAKERIDVGDLIRETAEMFGPAAGEKGLSVHAEVPPGQHAVIADEGALLRVLHNLIGNALKFTDDGSVTLGVRTETISNGPRVIVTVLDTGIGVDKEFLPRIFGAFEQESAGEGRRYEGAGLGLSLSLGLVEQMGGSITVDSEKGVGTEFTVSFPAAETANGPDTRPLVLVVDDDEHARRIAAHSLSNVYRVAIASSGERALDALEAERPSAVVLDIHLGMSISGEDVMQQLRDIPEFAGLPIVAVTAYSLPGDRDRFLAAGFDEYLTKPYERADLVAVVQRAREARSQTERAPGGGVYVSKSDVRADPAPTVRPQPSAS
ncbi:PAS domain S-box protein [Rubrivirga sp.]|uniref:PAS domain S-box protein n=1 Tax=Rubrivirga sp. TaxID=1885344 RepID=UPI003C71B413